MGIQMKVTKVNRGEYTVTVQGHNFLLSNGGEQHGNWTLSNALEVEINCVERKSDMLELMRQWSLDKANTEAATTNSWFSSSY
jgi:hypothetical protein